MQSSRGINGLGRSFCIDTGTPTGELVLTIIGGIAQFERQLMLERQREGIAKATDLRFRSSGSVGPPWGQPNRHVAFGALVALEGEADFLAGEARDLSWNFAEFTEFQFHFGEYS